MMTALKHLILAGAAALAPLSAAVAQPAAPSFLDSIPGDEATSGFVYVIPPAASAIPDLAALLEGERATLEADYDQARAEYAASAPGAALLDAFSLIKRWETMGERGRLLSLLASAYVFEGGAHGNSDYFSLLWDTVRGEAIPITALFADRYAALAHLDREFCARLRAMQAERFADMAIEEPWDECPLLHEMAIAPASASDGGPFSAFKALVPPYVAGPYAMGSFEIDLPVDAALIVMLRPEYREAFAVAR